MKDLPYQLEIAIGMIIMVTDNIKIDIDHTNEAQGEIVEHYSTSLTNHSSIKTN